MTALTWTPVSEALPNEGETVLLHLPDYQIHHARLATLVRGDPNHDGEYYRRDKWFNTTSHGWITEAYTQPDQQWARIPAPEGITWANVPATLTEPEPVPEPAPVMPPPADPTQPNLFGGAP